MNKSFTLNLTVILLLGMNVANLSAQMVWPGDINNSGRVTGMDLLYIGTQYWSSGPQRPNANTDWTAQPMGQSWNTNLPATSIDAAYADADGDGYISDTDITGGIDANFGKTHGTVTPDVFPPVGLEGIHPPISLSSPVTEAALGAHLEFDLTLGSQAFPLNHFFGISFKLQFDPQLVNSDITFEKNPDWWLASSPGKTRQLVKTDYENGIIEITIVRIVPNETIGFGNIGTISLNLSDNDNLVLPLSLNLAITDIVVIDSDMQKSSLFPTGVSLNIGAPPTNFNCPDIIAPVCGDNGVTYLNSCFAEAAGVLNYTEGVCFGSCINPELIDPDADCGDEYNPVCGCNGVTYINECVALAHGITTFSSGSCNSDCYDPYYIVTSAGTYVNEETGVISLDCPAGNDPVCGCNGITYANACIAEASGITFYTQGVCNENCVDPGSMNPNASCPTVYAPVCGCNEVTYSNACYAEAAGVTNYTPGVCGVSSPWCEEAIPIQCGDFLAYETTIGAGNQITSYPGCSNYTFQGPDKVYVLNKTTAGDLQIGLEITTPGMDLDLFLLADNCSQLTCIRSSTSSNSVTNNEGILYEDAPLGTYYIVVDGQYATSKGDYHIEVNCGYLYCGDAQPLVCGVPFQGNNMNGNDDVSLYGCDGNVFNVENNGPEMVHYFTTTEAGQVTITMTNLSANLELFLLRSCDRGDCMDYSQNSGTTNESITAWLQPGTYYVVVDGYNGGVGNYTLNVDCTSNCDLALVDLTSTPTSCGQNDGSIHIVSSGGTPGFIIHYSGPLSGSFYTNSNNCTLYHLPAGIYTVTKTDASGCSATQTVTVYSSGNLSVTLTPTSTSCMDMGSLWVTINNGVGPYNVLISGPQNSNLTSNNSSFEIQNLPTGHYTIYVTDHNGCSVSKPFEIDQNSGNFYYIATPHPGACGELGYIHVETYNGIAPYNILIAGPMSGYTTTNYSSFNIINLPAGTYTLTIEDGNWCNDQQVVVIGESNLDITAVAINGACGQQGSIYVNMSYGTGPYTVSWTGPVNGSTVTNNDSYTIQNLPTGNYQVIVEDDNWCSDYAVVQVNNSGGQLSFDVIPLDGTCSALGALWVDINNGTPPYIVTWSGPSSGTNTIYGDGFDIPNLTGGCYTVQITDASGCTNTEMACIVLAGNLDVDLTAISGTCGQNGSINVLINGGSPNFQINWTGPVNGSVSVNSNTYTITNLPSGTYSVYVTDASGCTDYAVVQLNNTTGGQLTLNATPINGTCNQLGGIWLDILGGSAPYSVSWTGPVSGSTTINNNGMAINNLPAGTYWLYVTDANGCSGSTNVQVVQTNNIAISLSSTPAGCGSYGSIFVNITNGTGPYSITWNGPSSGSTNTNLSTYNISNLPAGAYSIWVTDANGCSVDNNISILYTNNLDIVANPENGNCGQNGAIWVSINGGTPAYTIQWSGPVSGSATSNNGYNIANLPTGIYTITVTDANGCSDSQNVYLNNGGGTIDVTAIPTNGECGINGSIHVGISGGSPVFTITWSGPVSGTANTSNNFYNINGLPSGTYYITVIDANGCFDTYTVTINNGSNNLDIHTTLVVNNCGQYNWVWIDITGGWPTYTITWTGPQNGSGTTETNGFEIMDLPPGIYTITVTDIHGCSDTVTVTIYNAPVELLTLTGINGECGGLGTIVAHVIDGVPNYQISWTGPVSGSITTTSTTHTISNLPSGTYTFTLLDGNWCTDVEVITITNSPGDLDINTTLVPNDCGQYNWVWIDITGGWPTYTITWTGPQNGSGTTQGSGFEIIDLPPGVYTITVTDIHGCSTYEVVTIYNAPVELLTLTGVNGECGTYGSIIATVIGGAPNYQISWTGPVSGSVTTSNSTYIIQNLPSGTYTVTLLDGNWCTDVEVITITNTPNDLDIATTLVVNDCGQYNWVWIDINGGWPTYTITWTGPQNGSGTTETSGFEIMDLPPGVYTITVTDIHGCSVTVTVTIYNAPVELLTLTANNGDCNAYGSITANVIGGLPVYEISWTGPVSGSVSTNDVTYVIDNLPSGTYTVSLLDGNWCTDVEVITINNAGGNLTVVAVAVNGTCEQNGSIWLDIYNGTAPYTITWSGPVSGSVTTVASGYNIPNLPQGTYTVTVIDANGCSDTTVVYVSVSENDLSVIAVPFDGDCEQAGYIHIGITGGEANYIVNWSGPVSGSNVIQDPGYNITDLPAGTYTITITDSNGCSAVVMATINSLNTGLNVSAMASNGYCNGLGNIWMDFYNGSAPFTITWTGPVSGSTVTNYFYYDIVNLPSGTYIVTVTDTNGCAYTETFTIVNVIDDLTASLSAIQGGCGVPGSIQVNVTGGTPGYTITWVSSNASGSFTTNNNTYYIQNLPSGIYTVSIEDANGCGEITSIQLLNYPNNLQVYTTPVHPTCTQQGAIGLIFNGGSPDYNISWTGPVSGSATVSSGNYAIGNLPGGDYTININDANGCYAIVNVSLDSTPETPIVDFNFQISGLTATFTNLSAAGSYLWTFGDGTSSTQTAPTHQYLSSGSYQVCLTVTNSCGSATYCETIGVASGFDAVILDIGQGFGGPGTTIQVPVTIQNCNLLVSLAGTIQVDVNAVASVTGISHGLIAPQYNAINHTFNFYDNTGEGIPLTDGDILFYFNIELTGSAGSQSGLHLINNPLSIEVGGIVNDLPTVLPHITVPGSVQIMDTGIVEGLVSTYWGAGIKDVELLISAANISDTEMTNDNGVYSIGNLPVGQLYNIRPEKDNLPANGLSTYALFIGQRFILGMDPPQITSPYQVIAGDANCNGSFTTLDLFIIQQLIIGATQSFEECPSWVFVGEGNAMPEDFNAQNVFPYLSETSMMVMHDTIANFIGVKVGDILGHANPNNLQDDPDVRNDNELLFTTDNHQLTAGEFIDIPVSSSNFEDIVSFQMGLAIEAGKLGFVEFLPGDNPNFSATAAAFSENELRISWFNNQGTSSTVSPEEVLFTIRLQALQNIDDLNGLVAVSNHAITSVAHTVAGEAWDVSFQFNGVTATSDPTIDSFKLFQNEPNPFSDKTTIRFTLPASMEAELIIHDSYGRTLRQFNGQFTRGENSVHLSDLNLESGVYFYSLRAGNYADTRSMVILK
ncbi:MAG: T9SS type A sorting domain-containing protein [Lewinellaceae bacterium]|nr:T9SS type A sorting domain-containing protein [Lewinellaceae bacterium]